MQARRQSETGATSSGRQPVSRIGQERQRSHAEALAQMFEAAGITRPLIIQPREVAIHIGTRQSFNVRYLERSKPAKFLERPKPFLLQRIHVTEDTPADEIAFPGRSRAWDGGIMKIGGAGISSWCVGRLFGADSDLERSISRRLLRFELQNFGIVQSQSVFQILGIAVHLPQIEIFP